MKWISNVYSPTNKDAKEIIESWYPGEEKAWEKHTKWMENKMIGDPKGNEHHTVEEFKAMGYIGLYEIEKSDEESVYWLMDGRANFDVDRAMVLRTCGSYSDAKKHVNDYGADTCIVDVETQSVVYSLMWFTKE